MCLKGWECPLSDALSLPSMVMSSSSRCRRWFLLLLWTLWVMSTSSWGRILMPLLVQATRSRISQSSLPSLTCMPFMRSRVWKLRWLSPIRQDALVLDSMLVWLLVWSLLRLRLLMMTWSSCPSRLRVILRVRSSMSTMPTQRTCRTRVPNLPLVLRFLIPVRTVVLWLVACSSLLLRLQEHLLVKSNSPGTSEWALVSSRELN